MKRSLIQYARGYLLLIFSFIILLITSCQRADETREYGWFDFVISDLDSSATVVDMSFLNSEIAGSSGFITVKDGHFINGKGENRSQLRGTSG